MGTLGLSEINHQELTPSSDKLSGGLRRTFLAIFCVPLLALAAADAKGASHANPLDDAFQACSKIYNERPSALVGHWALVSGYGSSKRAGTACFYSTNEKSETEAKYYAMHRCWDSNDDFQCTPFGSSDSGLSDEMKNIAGRLRVVAGKPFSRGH